MYRRGYNILPVECPLAAHDNPLYAAHRKKSSGETAASTAYARMERVTSGKEHRIPLLHDGKQADSLSVEVYSLNAFIYK